MHQCRCPNSAFNWQFRICGHRTDAEARNNVTCLGAEQNPPQHDGYVTNYCCSPACCSEKIRAVEQRERDARRVMEGTRSFEIDFVYLHNQTALNNALAAIEQVRNEHYICSLKWAGLA